MLLRMTAEDDAGRVMYTGLYVEWFNRGGTRGITI